MNKFKKVMLGALSVLTLGLFAVVGTRVNADSKVYTDYFDFNVNSTSYTSKAGTEGTTKYGLTATAASKGSNSNFKISTANSIIGQTSDNYSYGVKLNASGNLKFTPAFDWSATLLIAAGAANSTVKYSIGDVDKQTAETVTASTYTATEVTLSGTGGSEITVTRVGGEVYVYEMILIQTEKTSSTEVLDSIAVSNNKTNFYVEDSVPTAADVTVTATYKDGDSTRNVTLDSSKYDFVIKNSNEEEVETATFASSGNYTATVSFTDTITKTASYNITVSDPANGNGTVFNADSLSTGDIATNKIINGTIYTVCGTSDSKLTVDKQTCTVDGKTFANRLKTNGTIKSDGRYIKIDVPSDGILYVIVAAGGSSGTRTVALYNDSTFNNDSLVNSYTTVVSGSSFTFAVEGNKTYYLGSGNSGINFTYIEFIPKSITVMQQEAPTTIGTAEGTYIRFIALVRGVTDISASNFKFNIYREKGGTTQFITRTVSTYKKLMLNEKTYSEVLPNETTKHSFDGAYNTEFYAVYVVGFTNLTYSGYKVYAGFTYNGGTEQKTSGYTFA